MLIAQPLQELINQCCSMNLGRGQCCCSCR